MNPWAYLMPSPLLNQWILTWGLGQPVRFILTLIFLIQVIDMIICLVRDSDSEPSPPSVAQAAGPSGGTEAPQFTIQYHPNSERAAKRQRLDHSTKRSPPRNLEPWSPFFKSREDFEISEILLKVGVPKGDCDRLFNIFRRCLDGKGSFNLNKYSEARSAWKRASVQLTSVSPRLGEVHY